MKLKLLWMILSSLIFIGCNKKRDDFAEIKRVLEKESATWRAADVKGHSECWKIQPYSKILVSSGDGTVIDVPPGMMINAPAESMGKGGTSINSNYKMKVNGNDAWVSHDEESTSREGNKTYSTEIRILEKINGEWKLVGQSIHIHKPQ